MTFKNLSLSKLLMCTSVTEHTVLVVLTVNLFLAEFYNGAL